MIDMGALLDSAIKGEGDHIRASQALPLVELLGRLILPQDGYGDDPRALNKTAVNEYGVGVTPVNRLSSVSPYAIGDGIMVETAAYGDANSTGDPFVIGRKATGPADAPEFLFVRKTFTGRSLPVQATSTAYVDDPTLNLKTRIPTNTNTTVFMLAYANAAAPKIDTQIDMRIRIGGSDVIGDPGIDNFDGAVGPTTSSGRDTAYQPLFAVHARTFNIKSDTDLYQEQNVNVRWHCHGGSGNANIRSALLVGIKVPW